MPAHCCRFVAAVTGRSLLLVRAINNRKEEYRAGGVSCSRRCLSVARPLSLIPHRGLSSGTSPPQPPNYSSGQTVSGSSEHQSPGNPPDSSLQQQQQQCVARGGGVLQLLYRRGLPQLQVPLPSRRELCRFTLRPVSGTVQQLVQQLCAEDGGIDRVVLRTTDGVRIAASDSIGSLIENDFELVINDDVYRVETVPAQRLSTEEMASLSSVRNLVSQLYEALNIEQHQLQKEQLILAQIEQLRVQLEPMEKVRKQLEAACHRRTTLLTWSGLGLMAVQFGVLARLTWWEYSWDIMEPVTYFVTYGTAMAAYAYFAVTKQDYVLPDVRDRAYLLNFYRRSRRHGLDVASYNQLRDQLHCLELDLCRLRDPLQMHLPPKHLEKPVAVQTTFSSLIAALRNRNTTTTSSSGSGNPG